MERYIKNQKTGKKYRITIATKKWLIKAVKKQPNKIFIVPATRTSKINKAYICYNTEYRFPEGFENANPINKED